MGVQNRKAPNKRCRRCGRFTYNVRSHYCPHCGYGRSAKIRAYSWQNKDVNGVRRD